MRNRFIRIYRRVVVSLEFHSFDQQSAVPQTLERFFRWLIQKLLRSFPMKTCSKAKRLTKLLQTSFLLEFFSSELLKLMD